jgi:hypothetical protein
VSNNRSLFSFPDFPKIEGNKTTDYKLEIRTIAQNPEYFCTCGEDWGKVIWGGVRGIDFLGDSPCLWDTLLHFIISVSKNRDHHFSFMLAFFFFLSCLPWMFSLACHMSIEENACGVNCHWPSNLIRMNWKCKKIKIFINGPVTLTQLRVKNGMNTCWVGRNYHSLHESTIEHLKKQFVAVYWWLTPVILATQEAEIRKIMVQGQPEQKPSPYLQSTQHTHTKKS